MILIFESITAALNAESQIEEWGLDIEPVPVPKSVSNQCGIALAVHCREAGQAVKALTVPGITVVIPAGKCIAV